MVYLTPGLTFTSALFRSIGAYCEREALLHSFAKGSAIQIWSEAVRPIKGQSSCCPRAYSSLLSMDHLFGCLAVCCSTAHRSHHQLACYLTGNVLDQQGDQVGLSGLMQIINRNLIHIKLPNLQGFNIVSMDMNDINYIFPAFDFDEFCILSL